MSNTTLGIVNTVVVVSLVISMFFPYQRFGIATEYSTFIRIIMLVVALGVGVRLVGCTHTLVGRVNSRHYLVIKRGYSE